MTRITVIMAGRRPFTLWELRLGPDNRFRVFYAVSHERREVQILAIGAKPGNRLMVAGEEIRL
jgi:hypothetical protein